MPMNRLQSAEHFSNTVPHQKPNKAVGPDKINARLLKHAVDVISLTLATLLIPFLKRNIFPRIWKKCYSNHLVQKSERSN